MANAIQIVVEQLRGRLGNITLEMLGAGRRLADALAVPLQAVLLGHEASGLSPALGLADKVIVVDDPALDMAPPASLAAALHSLQEQQPAHLVLLGATNLNMGVGSMLAARTGRPLANFCRSLSIEDGNLLVTSQLLGGKILVEACLPGARGIVSVCAGAFPADAGRADRTPAVSRVALLVPEPAVKFQSYIEPETGAVDITKEAVLVAVGRGLESQDNVVLAEELAEALGGAVCASRPVIDQGWLPLSRQVGKSGMSVQPRLYLALGISGAPEHWEGMQGAGMIVAVNTDPQAPIFDGAHYGVVGDAVELLPLLTERVKARQG